MCRCRSDSNSQGAGSSRKGLLPRGRLPHRPVDLHRHHLPGRAGHPHQAHHGHPDQLVGSDLPDPWPGWYNCGSAKFATLAGPRPSFSYSWQPTVANLTLVDQPAVGSLSVLPYWSLPAGAPLVSDLAQSTGYPPPHLVTAGLFSRVLGEEAIGLSLMPVQGDLPDEPTLTGEGFTCKTNGLRPLPNPHLKSSCNNA